MEKTKGKEANVTMVGISKGLLFCESCRRNTHTIVRLVSGKSEASVWEKKMQLYALQ